MSAGEQNISPVPEDISYAAHINKRWAEIERDAYQGLPFSHPIQALDDLINNGIAAYNQNQLLNGYDWKADLDLAISTHRFKKDWLQRTLLMRQEYVSWWREYVATTHRDLVLAATEARKLLLLSHGAAILGAMAALATIQNPKLTSAFLVVAIGGLIGFMLATAGIIVWLESFGGMITKLHSDFRSTHTMRRYEAYGRYARRRYKNEARWSIWLSYASVIALPIYSSLALAFAAY